MKNVTVTKLTKENDVQWIKLDGADDGTDIVFENSVFGIYDDGTIVDEMNEPLTDGDWEIIAVRNSLKST